MARGTAAGQPPRVGADAPSCRLRWRFARRSRVSTAVRSPTVGTVLEILASVGAAVSSGDEILLLESMKMEIPVIAPRDGRLLEILVAVGDPVEADEVLARLD